MHILVLNAGSSSVKYQVIDSDSGVCEAKGSKDDLVTGGVTSGHEQALAEIVGEVTTAFDIGAVGHRVVHGGQEFVDACVIDDEVEARIAKLSPLAPLHNPWNLAGITAAKAALPHVDHVAVFDTAFHQTMPPEASTVAIDQGLATEHGIRKYGFHGTSHRYVSHMAEALLGDDSAPHRLITLHLGNGSSVAAIKDGQCVDTSMGFTPLQGLVMGTRVGDIDPSVVTFLLTNTGKSVSDIDTMLNKESGLVALAGSSDFREVVATAETGDPRAQLALDVWAWRIRHYIGAYAALLGGVDGIVFTGGIGENSALARSLSVVGLEFMGISLDSYLNERKSQEARTISPHGATVRVMVIPTNEELEIARQTHLLITQAR